MTQFWKGLDQKIAPQRGFFAAFRAAGGPHRASTPSGPPMPRHQPPDRARIPNRHPDKHPGKQPRQTTGRALPHWESTRPSSVIQLMLTGHLTVRRPQPPERCEPRGRSRGSRNAEPWRHDPQPPRRWAAAVQLRGCSGRRRRLLHRSAPRPAC